MKALETSTQLAGIAGTWGAGKDTAATHLTECHRYMHLSTGDVLRAEADRLGLGRDRETLIDIAIGLRKTYGHMGALCLMGREQWEERRDEFPGGLIISGLRIVAEAQAVKDMGGSLVFVDAPLELRHQRVTTRNRDGGDTMSLEEFTVKEGIELEGTGDSNRPHIRGIQALADVEIWNANSSQTYIQKLDGALGLPAC